MEGFIDHSSYSEPEMLGSPRKDLSSPRKIKALRAKMETCRACLVGCARVWDLLY